MTASARTATTERIERLNTVSARRILDPDEAVPGAVGPGQLIPDDLLVDLGVDVTRLTAQQRVTLSREAVASMYSIGLRIEAALIAGFAARIATSELTDARTVYMLHEVGEETRHSRLFSRIIDSIGAQARLPVIGDPRFAVLERLGTGIAFGVGMQFPSAFNAMVLAGEEIPDLLQKKIAEHPACDPLIREASRYHRLEEARHLSFARMMVGELWERSWWGERVVVRRIVPLLIAGLFDAFVHPGVYSATGLPGVKTWLAVRRSPRRVALRHAATRPVLDALIEGGALRRGRIPARWRRLCGVDRQGRPVRPPAAAVTA
jgi:hypothetical protein